MRTKNLSYFPQNLENFFKNIKGFEIFDCSLKEVHQSDLKQFPKLTVFRLNAIELEVIEQGLFDFNPDLECISLSNSRILQIHPNVFDNLSKLHSLLLQHTQCINMYSWNNSVETKNLIMEVINKCPIIEEGGSVIDCGFYDDYWGKIGDHYTCNVQNNLNIDTFKDSFISSVKGTHNDGRTNDDVASIDISFKNVKHFPKNLEKFFKNLQGIWISNSNLEEIHQSDLKSFPKLIALLLNQNNIEILEEGLFDFNTELELIYLQRNKISQIHPYIFDHLPKLTDLSLIDNLCIDMSSRNRNETEEIIKKLKNQSSDSDYSTKNFIAQDTEIFEGCSAEKSQILLLKQQLEKMERSCGFWEQNNTLKAFQEEIQARLSISLQQIIKENIKISIEQIIKDYLQKIQENSK